MKTYHVFLTYFLLALASTSAHAQGLTGKLTEAPTGQPIAFASLSLSESAEPKRTRYTTSDSTGGFAFARLNPGSYRLSAQMMGYKMLSMEVNIAPGQQEQDLGKLRLVHDSNQLGTVTITGGRPNFATHNGQLKVAVASNPFFRTNTNLTEVLRRIPGLQVNPDGTMLLSSGAAPALFIDGKPTLLSAQEIQSYLGGLSPENVETIELLSQPSGKYDGQFHGIIDIRLKDSAVRGLRGNYGLRLQQNQRTLIDNSLWLAYRTTKFSHGLSLTATNGSSDYRYHAQQRLPNTHALLTDTRTTTGQGNYTVQLRTAYEPKKGQVLETYLRSSQIDRSAQTTNQLVTMDAALDKVLGQSQGDNAAQPAQQSYAGGLNYDHIGSAAALHLQTAIAHIGNDQREDIRNWTLDQPSAATHWKTRSANAILIRTLQGDYQRTIGSGKLEMGIKYALTGTENELRYDTLSKGNFHLDPSRSNQFSYREQLSAVYLSYSENRGRTSFSLALRAEHTSTRSGSQADKPGTLRDYLKWLPSASLAYQLGSTSELSLNYSRRLTRPSFEALNPFRFYYSARHYWIGNPLLQPSTTSEISLTFSHSALHLTLAGGRETDPMVRYPEYDPATNVLIFKGTNLPYRDFVNLSASMPLTLRPWWKTSNSLSLAYNREQRPYFGQTFRIPVYNYTFTGNQLFTLKALTIDLSYSLQSQSGNSLYVFAPVRTVDIGLQRSWSKGKFTSKLSVQDIFNGGRRRVIFRERSIMDNDFYHDYSTRRFLVALSYRWGGGQRQKELKRSEEENRAGQ